MEHSKLFKTFIFIGVLFATLILSMYIASKVINKGSNDLTTDLPRASLPVVSLGVNGEYINELHGYTNEMSGSYLRGSLTPLSANRTIPIKIEYFDSIIMSVGYEVRSIDCTRLIENHTLEELTYEEDNYITATIPVKDLIDDDTEYMLVIICSLSNGKTAKYYARFIDRPELYLDEKMSFVKDFSSKTFDKIAADDLRQYMESNSEGDNSSFGHVNIHSNFKQLTWGDLEPMVMGDKKMTIWDIDSLNACISLNYQVLAKGSAYDVSEYFRLVRGSKRMHLMEYERTMDQVFDDGSQVVVNGKILHGILSNKLEISENDDASVVCFVQQDRLYSYNRITSNLTRIFSFWDTENNDSRTRYMANNIKVLDVDEQGNVFFLVYGYMNRGHHEGETGVAIYHYDCVINANDEVAFIPYDKSYEILKHDIVSLSYLNARRMFYILLDGTIYSVNLNSGQHTIIATGLDDKRFVSSEDNSMIAWQPEEELTKYTTLRFMSLESASPIDISTGGNSILLPLGFMNKDFVYGVVKLSDITSGATGRQILPMYQIKIQDLYGNLLKTYEQPGFYTVDAFFEDNTIRLSRLCHDPETGQLIPGSDDQIMNKEALNSTKNRFAYVVTEEMETTYQTQLYKSPTDDNFKVLNPKEVMYEGDKNLFLKQEDSVKRYYVYAKGKVDTISTRASDAVNRASEIFGSVVDRNDNYIWEAGNRKSKVNLPDIEPVMMEEGDSSIAICLDTMLKYSGTYVETKKLLSSGENSLSIMKKNLDGDTLDLTGCSTSSILYYVSSGYPVMAFTNDGNAVLIVGYDANNTVLFDPIAGTVAKKGIMDSEAFFDNNRNRFLSYVPYK